MIDNLPQCVLLNDISPFLDHRENYSLFNVCKTISETLKQLYQFSGSNDFVTYETEIITKYDGLKVKNNNDCRIFDRRFWQILYNSQCVMAGDYVNWLVDGYYTRNSYDLRFPEIKIYGPTISDELKQWLKSMKYAPIGFYFCGYETIEYQTRENTPSITFNIHRIVGREFTNFFYRSMEKWTCFDCKKNFYNGYQMICMFPHKFNKDRKMAFPTKIFTYDDQNLEKFQEEFLLLQFRYDIIISPDDKQKLRQMYQKYKWRFPVTLDTKKLWYSEGARE